MLTLCKIDGVTYDVLVTAIQEKTEVIEGANSGVSIQRQREIRDILGIKIGHAVTFAPDNDPDEFDKLYKYLFRNIRQSVMIEIADGTETISYEAAYNTCTRDVTREDDFVDRVHYNEMTIDFRPIENQIDAG